MLNNVEVLNLIGLACPMPIIRLKKALAQLKNQADKPTLQVFFSDKGGLKDIPAFCQQTKLNCRLPKEGEKLLLDNFEKVVEDKNVYCLVITFDE